MSSGTQVALLPPIGRHDAAPRVRSSSRAERPLVRLVAFAALALYGVTRWAALMQPSGIGRLLGLFGVAVAVAGAGPFVARRSRMLMVLAAVLSVLAAFALAGVPLAWIVHLRVAVTASAIEEGLSSLPRALVPYPGINQWVRIVITLGAAVLLLDAALLLAFAPRALGDGRRAGAALPLVALVAVPETLVRPQLPYIVGLLLFGLLAAFMWGERVERGHAGTAAVLCGGAAVAAMILAPGLDQHKPWLNYEQLATKLATAHIETFDWAQTYGPVQLPHAGRPVLEVQASQPEYWKAENLDVFDGTGWAQGAIAGYPDPVSTISAASTERWTQTLAVTIRDMSTSEVIAAGDASPPTRLTVPLGAGQSPGTWTTVVGQLGPGDSYSVRVYDPQPSAAQLASAGTHYPGALLPGYLTVGIPEMLPSSVPTLRNVPHPTAVEPVTFPSFGATVAAQYGPTATNPAAALASSPYAAAYTLARRLARHAVTPYQYVLAVERYLAHGFIYSQRPRPTAYPLETFLFTTKLGYCQQFAGAMALLLRMGGVPARVAVGFTQGRYDSATHRWVVTDRDAHAWVEAWFPHYGWVKFDPTPAADPALGGHVAQPRAAGAGAGAAAKPVRRSDTGTGSSSRSALGRKHHGSSVSPAALVAVGAALAALALLALLGTRSLGPGEPQLAELERAFSRSGRPLSSAATLAAIERRLAASPAAAAYVRALRLQRFGAATQGPSARERRALRGQLAAGLGLFGRLRSLWALPPRRGSRGRPQDA